MDCPSCYKPLKKTDKEDFWDIFIEFLIASGIGAIFVVPLYFISEELGYVALGVAITVVGYLSYTNYRSDQLYRCHDCQKAYRGKNLREVSW